MTRHATNGGLSGVRGSFLGVVPGDDGQIKLVFDGPPELVSPDKLDAQKALAVALAFVETLQAVGAYEAAGDDAPFLVVLRSLKKGSVTHAYDAVSCNARDVDLAARVWAITADRLPLYLESGSNSPSPIAKRIQRLAKVTRRLPSYVDATATSASGSISLSEIARREPIALIHSAETFRAEILRAGGQRPRIQIRPAHAERPIVLDATALTAKVAGASLYQEAEVTASLYRRPDKPFDIVSGFITALQVVDSDEDAVAAFDRWYERSKSEWHEGLADIGKELRRGRH